nr:hypothetical protein [Tanacetum cinerariifolium]
MSEAERAKDAAYHREKMLLCKQDEARIQLNAEQADWKDDTDDESDDQELEAHYMYMAKLQQVSPDIDDSGPIFDKEPEQKVQNEVDYDVFAIDCQHSEQSKSVHNTYLTKQDAQSMLIESEDMNYDSEQIEQNDEDVDLAKEPKRHEENSNLIKEIRASMDAAVRNQGASIKTLEIQIGQVSKEKMLLCKQEEAEIQLNAEQADWRNDNDDESDD